MATFRKPPRRGELGEPPKIEEAGENLKAPETAPPKESSSQKADGRTLRKTGRTHPFATRITPILHKRIKMIAARDEVKVAELLEHAIEAYEYTRASR
jgi:hypothetical protein